MAVEVRLYGTLRRYRPSSASGAPHHPFTVHIPDGSTVETLLDHLSIAGGLVNAAAVNDEAVELSTRLSEGDRVALFPAAAGG